MKLSKKTIMDESIKSIKKHNLFFIDDIVAFVPFAKSTFYKYIRPDSDEMNELKKLLAKNRIDLKVSLRSRWYESESPALQMGLMKLLASDDELSKLSLSPRASKTQESDNETGVLEVPGMLTIEDWEKAGQEALQKIEEAHDDL